MADNPFLGSANPQQFIQQQQLLPPEMQQESRDISRQQRLADMLTGQVFNQPQGQMVSGRYVAPSFFQNLAPLAQAYFGNQISEKAGAKQVALAQGLRERQVKDAELYSEAMSGVPADETTGRPAIAPDYKAAVRIALNSYDPAIRAQGMEMLKGIKLGEGESIQRMNLGTGKMESVATGGAKMPDTIKTAAMTLGITGDPTTWTPQQTQAVANQVLTLKSATAPRISLTQNTEKTYGGALADQFATTDMKLFTQAQGVPQMIQNVETQRTLLNDPNVFVGAGADKKLELAKVADFLGLGGKDLKEKITNTQRFYGGRAGATLDSISASGLGAGNGFTNKDLEFLRDAKLGNITYTKEALAQQLEIEEKAARVIGERANNRLAQIPESARKPLGLTPIVIPQSTRPSAPPAGVTQEQWNVMTPEQRNLFGG